jgi:hypothetical protein
LYGAYDEDDLLKTGTHPVDPATVTSNFKDGLHKNGQFFKVAKNNRNKIVLEVTKESTCAGIEDLDYSTELRYTIYDKCNTPTVLDGGIIDTTESNIIILDISTFPNNFFIAFDTPIVSNSKTNCLGTITTTVYKNIPLCGCVGIYQRDIEYSSVTISWGSIRLDKEITWSSNCSFVIPKVNSCDVVPYQKGEFAYWESTETYSDNAELFNSAQIKIKPEDLVNLNEKDLEEFEKYYTNGLDNGNYVYKTDQGKSIADFTCREIRHFKFPDNTVAPFMIDLDAFSIEADSVIFPLGVSLDSNVVKTMLEVAYNNGLITKKQKNSIVSYEILRGDNSIHKSVIANGIGFDMYKYDKNKDTVHYPNFPFNDLGFNKFSTKLI